MKPNIFNYAKSELTNDAIICWLLDWTNSEHEIYKNLYENVQTKNSSYKLKNHYFVSSVSKISSFELEFRKFKTKARTHP